MVVAKKPVEKPAAKPAVVKASSELTGDEKNEINKLGLTDEIRARAAELGLRVTNANGDDLPRFDVEESIRKAEEAKEAQA